MPRFTFRSTIPAEAAEVFAWHQRPGAFQRLTPPWEKMTVESGEPRLEAGARWRLRLSKGLLKLGWIAEITEVEQGRGFQDIQRRGPFRRWEHAHRFTPSDAGMCVVEDEVDYELPLGRLGELVAGGSVRRRLDRLFRYRHATLRGDLERHRPYADRPRLRVAISGASGLIGSALRHFLSAGGHEVLALVRRPARNSSEISWDPRGGHVETERLEGLDGLVHLAGENIGSGLWTAARKRRILRSRVDGTRLLAEAVARLESPPRIFLHASGADYYGDRGEERITEESGPGSGFLAEVCRQWEAAAEPARRAGVRVIPVRFGMVLSAAGGALTLLLPLYRLGLGATIGSGRQFMSWIGRDDLVGVLHELLWSEALSGPVNGVAPQSLPQREFSRTLASVLHRPHFLRVPAFAIRLALGEMGETLVLHGARIEPARLMERGFAFRHPRLDDALRYELGL
ncbi:MAG: TIGR01777 family protein [Candidatus Eisenbacteria bacterium]|nr:TIGR01777 family protein [Candidatus Eisenbacteria bacterium]